jgi:hypothetical protein
MTRPAPWEGRLKGHGGAAQRLGGGGALLERGDAGAGAQARDVQLGDRADEAGGGGLGVLGGAAEQDGELVGARAAQPVVAAQ